MCAALSAAHAQGLVHRDLKPENIFLQRDASGVVPKVLDFGLAKAFREHLSLSHPVSRRTSVGLLIGTFEYMAPEQVAGDEVDPSWDVWAVAIIAYEMITGSPPFRRQVTFDAGDGVTVRAEPFGAGIAELPEAAAALFRAALSPERSSRPGGALEFLAACERTLT